MVFFELRWNYSPLKEKAVLLPDGLFICFCRSAHASLHTAQLFRPGMVLSCSWCAPLGATRASRHWLVDKICLSARSFAPYRSTVSFWCGFSRAPDTYRSAPHGPRGMARGQNLSVSLHTA